MRSFILHNPRCSKSRQTLAILQEKGIDFDIVEYLDAPPSTETLETLCKTLGVTPLEIMRTQENRFKELGLTTADERTTAAWIEIMMANPILIERPIFYHNGRAAIGRPPENVLTIL